MRVLLDEIQHIDASNRAVLGFGRVFAGIGLLVSTWMLYRLGWTVSPATLIPAGVGLILWLLAARAPSLLRPVYRVWMMIAVVLGFIMTRVILFIVFILVVTPTGLIMRALGRDPLPKQPDATQSTYWIPKAEQEPASIRFRRLY